MSKNTRIAIIAGLALLAVGIVVMGLSYIFGARPEQVLRDGSYGINDVFGSGVGIQFGNGQSSTGGRVHISSPTEIDNDDELSGMFSSSFSTAAVANMDIEINWVSGKIEILRWDKDEILFEETADRELSTNQLMRYNVSKNGRNVEVNFNKGNISIFGSMPTKYLTVTLPYDVDISCLTINGTSCDTRIEETLTVKDFNFNTTSGTLTANINVEDFDFSSVSGDANIVGSFEEIEIDTTSGDAKIGCLKAPDKIDFDTVSGCASIALPSDSGFKLDFDSVSGEFESSIPTIKSGGSYSAGDGHTEIDFDSVSGDLNIFYK